MKCQISSDIYVSTSKIINKIKYRFYYTFSETRGKFDLRIFEVTTTSPFLDYHDGKNDRCGRGVLFLSKNYNKHYFKDRYSKVTITPPAELVNLKKLKDVKIPIEVSNTVNKKINSLKSLKVKS